MTQENLGLRIDIIIGITGGLIAIYIPVGIYVLTNSFGNDNVFKIIDQKIITKKLFNVPIIIILFLFIFLGLTLIISHSFYRIIAIVVSLTLLSIYIYQAYLRSFPNHQVTYRKNLLMKETDKDIRKSILGSSTATQDETELITKSFFQAIEKLDSRKSKSHFLELFLYHTQGKENYQMIFSGYGDFSIFKKLLDLYYKSWTLDKHSSKEKDFGREASVIERILTSYLSSIYSQQKHHIIFIIQEHRKEYSSLTDYVKDFEANILRIILSSENLLKDLSFLRSLVKQNPIFEIQVNDISENTKKHLITVFLDWLKEKIQDNKTIEEYNSGIDYACHFLLPGVDNITFVTLFTFGSIWFDPENRVKSYYQHKNNFGHIGRVHTYIGESSDKKLEKSLEEEVKNAIRLFDLIINIHLDEIEKHINECKKLLALKLESYELSRIRRLKYCLEELKKVKT